MKYSMKRRSCFITRGTLVGLALGAMVLLDSAPAQSQTNLYWVLVPHGGSHPRRMKRGRVGGAASAPRSAFLWCREPVF
jgi:hypothetical protein